MTKMITRDQAYQAMQNGKQVSHESFTDEEFLYMGSDGVIYDEQGNVFTDGWDMRCGAEWAAGWFELPDADHPVLKMLADQLAESKRMYAENQAIQALFEKHKGKTTRIFKNADFANFKFSEQYGQRYLHGEFRHFIGYVGRDDKLDPVTFAERSVSSGASALGWIEKIERIDKVKLIKIWETIKGHYEGLRQAFGDLERAHLGSYNNPIFYPMLDLIQNAPDIQHGSPNIKLSDMYYVRK